MHPRWPVVACDRKPPSHYIEVAMRHVIDDVFAFGDAVVLGECDDSEPGSSQT